MRRLAAIILALLLSLPAVAQTTDEAAANSLFVEAVEAWRRAEGLAGEDLSRIQERLRALRIVDNNLRRIVEQHKSSSLAVKLVVGERIGPLGLADTRRAIEAAQQQEKEALLKALEEAADRNVRAHGGAPSPRPPATASPAPAPSPPSTAARPAPTPTPAPVAPAAQPSAAEVSFWESVRNSRDPAELEAYLTAFPQGTFAPLARTRLQSLRPTQQAAPAQRPATPQAAPRAVPNPPNEQEAEVRLWQQVRESRNIRDLNRYLERYPRGAFADLARARIEELRRVAQSQPGAVTSPTPRATSGDPSLAPGRFVRDCPECPEMVVVPSGSTRLASGLDVVIATAFAVGKYEVTFAEWDACVSAGGCSNRPYDRSWGRGRQPVMNVSWDDAQQYVAWLSRRTGKTYRLLSEAEWEYAAQAGGGGEQAAQPGANQANCAGCGSRWDSRQTAPVGSFAANAFGLHDMLGNVSEWTADCWNDSISGSPRDGSARQSGDCSRRVLRGGSWDSSPWLSRSAFRFGDTTVYRYVAYGFRVARTL
jgi:formylglycine-generating enzyme required for sulfatase activity